MGTQPGNSRFHVVRWRDLVGCLVLSEENLGLRSRTQQEVHGVPKLTFRLSHPIIER